MKTAIQLVTASIILCTSLPLFAANNCEELMASTYLCTAKDDLGNIDQFEMYKYSPSGGWDFELYVSDYWGSDTLHQCICQAKGSFKKPGFRESAEFLCNDAGNYSEAMVGKVTKKSIKKGQYMEAGGTYADVFECDAVLP